MSPGKCIVGTGERNQRYSGKTFGNVDSIERKSMIIESNLKRERFEKTSISF